MKRALAALPLLALALGIAVFLLRRPAIPSGAPEPPGAAAAPGASSGTPASPPPAAAPSATSSAPEVEGGGAIHFLVTMRGRPAAGALLTVARESTPQFRRFTTEEDGTQLLRGLPPGDYSVTVRYPDAITYSGMVKVEGAETREAVIDLKSGARIFGTVTDKSGRPASKVRVVLVNQQTRSPAPYPEGLTDEQGRYALRGLLPGHYQVRFRHDVLQPLDRSDVIVQGPDDHQQVDVVLAMGSRLSGRVVDESGSPVEGATLIAGNGSSAGTARSAADGSFTISALTEVPANLSAAKTGFGKVVIRNVPANSTDLVLRLVRPGTLIGRLHIDAMPRKVQVVLTRFDNDLRQVIPAESRSLAPPADGTFTVTDVPPGTYWVEVQVEGYEAVERPQTVVTAGQTTSEVSISMRKKN